MKKIAIQDVDLANGNILNKVVKCLDYEFVIPDLVLEEVTSPSIAKEDLNVLIRDGLIIIETYLPSEISLITD